MKINEFIQHLSRKLDRGNCWLFHDWGKWEDIQIRLFDDWGRHKCDVTGQRRYCLRCNKRDSREV